MKRIIAVIHGRTCVFLLVLATFLVTGSSANAIPGIQAKCSNTDVSITAAYGFQPLPGLSVKAKAGVDARNAIVQISTVPLNNKQTNVPIKGAHATVLLAS